MKQSSLPGKQCPRWTAGNLLFFLTFFWKLPREDSNVFKRCKALIPNQPHALPILLENMDHQFPHRMKGRQSNSLASSALSLFLWLQIEHLCSLTHISYQTAVARSRFRLLFQHGIRPCHQNQIYLIWSLDCDISDGAVRMHWELKLGDIKQMFLRGKRKVLSASTMIFTRAEETLSIGLIKLSFACKFKREKWLCSPRGFPKLFQL